MSAPLKNLYIGDIFIARIRSWSEAAELINHDYATDWLGAELSTMGHEAPARGDEAGGFFLPSKVAIGRAA